MDPAIPIAVHELLEHSGWMRALARQLVRDAAAADDVVQEAYLAALRLAREGERAHRGWLARVVYNQAALHARGERNRRAREERSARDEALPSSSELAARAELYKLMAAAVHELRDPYRSVLVLRYYEDLSPEEIARRQGVPSATVRSQITRGEALVRDRLDVAHGGDRRAWSLALVPIAVERDALVVGAAVSSILVTSLIAMPLSLKLIVSGLIAMALWLALFFREHEVSQPTVVAAVQVHASKSQATTRAPEDLANSEPTAVPTDLGSARTEAPTDTTNSIEAPAAELALDRGPDLNAREWVTFRVADEYGFPVARAEINLNAMWTRPDNGTGYGWSGHQPSHGTTGVDGTLRLQYPVWIDRDWKTGAIGFTVTHPDYVTYETSNVDNRDVAPEIGIPVIMSKGLVFAVRGWIGNPSQVATDVRVHFSRDVNVNPEDWLQRSDGYLMTTRVPQGRHLVYVEHESTPYGLMFSDGVEFVLGARGTELNLELKAARRVVGRLDDSVPRPVVGGRVALALMRASETEFNARQVDTHEAPVDADGLFVIERLPSADAQIVAICKGWASKREPRADSSQPHATQAELARISMEHQFVDLRGERNEIVVAMEPTAILQVELRDANGSPVPGATLSASPNRCWFVGGCGMFVNDRAWFSVTDTSGIARIEDIPAAAGTVSFGVFHAEYELPLEPSDFIAGETSRERFDVFVPGKTLTKSYTLDRKRDR